MGQELECRDDAPGAGCRVLVRAQPGARREGLAGTWNGRLKLAVNAPPEDGRANARLVELLAGLLELKRGQIELVAGERSRNKEFHVALRCSELRARLRSHLEPGAPEKHA